MQPANIVYTLQAENDLDLIFQYIAENSIMNALKYIDKMKLIIEKLSTSPYIGVNCKSKGINRDCRILIFEKYLIFYNYNESDNEIKIIRILHGSRKYLDLMQTYNNE